MNHDVSLLIKEFKKIRKAGLIKSLRTGTTGLGYTFESLLNKKEDQECKPDFGSVELKCKLGYSKTRITLFTSSPYRNNEFATRYILEKYGYNDKSNLDQKHFSRRIFCNYTRSVNDYEFRLKVDYEIQRLIIQAYYKGNFIEDVCYWEFKTLETKLKIKLTNLAIIYGYPYKYNNIQYYKYLKMEIYKLKGFFEFLKLIENDKISICVSIKDGVTNIGTPQLYTHGVSFQIRKEDLRELFYYIMRV